MPKVVENLLKSRRFWLGVVGVASTVLGVGFGINPNIITAIQTFAGALIAAYTIEDTATALKGG